MRICFAFFAGDTVQELFRGSDVCTIVIDPLNPSFSTIVISLSLVRGKRIVEEDHFRRSCFS